MSKKIKKLENQIEDLTAKISEMSTIVLAISNTQKETQKRVLKALEEQSVQKAPAKPATRRRRTSPKATAAKKAETTDSK